MTSPRAAGSVHGRFQPLHNGHLEYILAAFESCDFLYIGITQYLRHKLVQVDSAAAVHRGEPQSNPLSYFERAAIIDAVLTSEGIGRDRYVVTPFPIEEPTELREFLPTSVRVFTTTYDDWNKEKIQTLEELGYTVVNLWSRAEKEFVGAQIRSLMRDDDPSWTGRVPAAAAPLIEQFALPERLRNLGAPSGT